MFKKLKNGQWLDFERGVYLNYAPFLEGKTLITRTYGLVRVVEFKDIPSIDEGKKFAFPAFCGALEKRKNTDYANFIDFEHINTGKRPSSDGWIDINLNLQPNRAYMLLCKKDEKMLEGFRIINKRLLTCTT